MADFELDNPAVVAVYDDLPLWSAACGQLLLDTIELRPEMRVLDVGCGTGFPLVELAERLGPRSEVHGVDLWGAALARAREKIRVRGVAQARVHEASADALPFPDAHFDLVVSNLGINNFAAPDKALRECRRVCKEGATIALSTNLLGTMAELYEAYEAALGDLGYPDARARIERLANARVSRGGAEAELRAAGFAPSSVAESIFRMRYADGAAVLRHSFLRLAFIDGWAGAANPGDRDRALAALSRRLDEARGAAGITLTVPIACFVARAS